MKNCRICSQRVYAALIVLIAAINLPAQQKTSVWVSTPRTLPEEVTPNLKDWFDVDNAILYQSSALRLIHNTIGNCFDKPTQTSNTNAVSATQTSSSGPAGVSQGSNNGAASAGPQSNSGAAGATPASTLGAGDAAGQLAISTCGPDTTKSPFPGSKDYVVIHVLRWKDPATNSTAQSVDKQNWYVFHNGTISKKGVTTESKIKDDPKWDDDAYSKNNRVFGRRNVYLLYVHFNRGANSLYSARYEMTAKKKTPAYIDHFVSLLQVFGVGTKTGGGQATSNVWDATALDAYYVPSDLTFAPTMLPIPAPSSSTSAAPQGSTTSTGGPPAAAASAQSAPSSGSTTPSQQQPSANTPQPGTVSSTLPPLAPQAQQPPPPGAGTQASGGSSSAQSIPTDVKLDSQMFDNEGLYHIDFSVAVPVRKISEISYASSSNTLVPTQVDKQTTFGVIDYYFKAVDIKGSGFSPYPHALAGVAVDSHPLKRVLIGGGYGPLLAHFYMGLLLDTQSLPQGGSCGKVPTSQQTAAGNFHNRTCTGLSLGINVSAGSVLSALKPKSSTGSGSKSK